MIEVRNLLFQPLTFQLKGGAGLHLGPRERRKIREDQLSPEISKAARRSLLALATLPDEAPAPLPAEAATQSAESGETEPLSSIPDGNSPAGDETSACQTNHAQSPAASRKRR